MQKDLGWLGNGRDLLVRGTYKSVLCQSPNSRPVAALNLSCLCIWFAFVTSIAGLMFLL
jgi:hypothetical protein